MQPIRGLLVLALLSCAGCGGLKTAPPELMGMWRTDAAGFSGRFISIDTHYIVFGAGEEEHPNAEAIESIREKDVAGGKVFIIRANDMEGNRDDIEIEYVPAGHGQLRLASRKQVLWARAE